MDQAQIARWEKKNVPDWFLVQLREVLVEVFRVERGEDLETVLRGLTRKNRLSDDDWTTTLRKLIPDTKYFLRGNSKDGWKLGSSITSTWATAYSVEPSRTAEEAALDAVKRYNASPDLAEALKRFVPEGLIRDIAYADISEEFNPEVRVYTHGRRS